MKGMQGGKGIIFKPTQKQINGGFLGTLAANGISMASKLFRKGLQVIKKKPRGARKRITCRPKTKKFISLLSTSFFRVMARGGQGLLLRNIWARK